MSKYKLNQVCTDIVDSEHKTAPTVSEGVPYIRTPNIGFGRMDSLNLRFVSYDTYKKWSKRIEPEKNDVILAREAPVGNAIIVKDNNSICLGQRTVLLRPNKKKIDPNYLLFLILSPIIRSKLLSLSSGATVAHLNLRDLRNLDLPDLPPIEDQKRIAQIISDYDSLIENNTRCTQILEEIAQRLYEEWFVHFKFSGSEKVKMVDSELGKIPKGWNIVKTSEIIDFDPKTLVNKNSKNKYLSMGSISEYSMVISHIEIRKGNAGSKFQNEDTLLARISPSLENGKTGFVNFLEANETAFGSTEFIVMRSKSVCPEYVYCLARSSKFRVTAIKSMKGATGRQRVQRDALENFKVALPNDNKLMKEFHSALEPMFDQIFSLNKKNEILSQTRDLLLPKLISGEIEV